MEENEVLEKVLSSLKASESLLKAVLADKSITAEKITIFDIKLENLEEDVESLLHIVRGNGHDGLQVRIKLVEDHINTISRNCEKRSTKSKGSWIVWAAVVSGLTGLLTSIVTALLK